LIAPSGISIRSMIAVRNERLRELVVHGLVGEQLPDRALAAHHAAGDLAHVGRELHQVADRA
jgi:hypothetical protein